MIVTDIQADKWDVRQGDPAWPAIQSLRKWYQGELIIPLSILLGMDPVQWLKADDIVGDDARFLYLAAAFDQQRVLKMWYNDKEVLNGETREGEGTE